MQDRLVSNMRMQFCFAYYAFPCLAHFQDFNAGKQTIAQVNSNWFI